jgi:hypothetical protein
MQRRLSAFNKYTIEAPDGNAGYVTDSLFADNDWKLRWFVINAGSWLFGNNLLISPASLGRPDIRQHAFPVTLMKAQVKASRSINSDQPISLQMEDPNAWADNQQNWDADGFVSNGFGSSYGLMSQHEAVPAGDPHLRSLAQLIGYNIHALDGDIGHLEDFLVDDETWQIEHAVIDTKNWGSGKHVLVPVTQIKSVNWGGRYIRIDQTRYTIKCSPSWEEPDWSNPPVL